MGVRYFDLHERDDQPNLPASYLVTERREWIAHVGVDLGFLHERVRFRPTLYVDLVDNDEFNPTGVTPPDRDSGYIAKINLPLEVAFERGYLTINPTLRLDRIEFGGGGVQLQVRF